MAICEYCDQEMSLGVACTDPVYGTHERIVFGGDGDPCHDCNTPRGGLHHPGCDVERCPICLGQAISCGCDDA